MGRLASQPLRVQYSLWRKLRLWHSGQDHSPPKGKSGVGERERWTADAELPLAVAAVSQTPAALVTSSKSGQSGWLPGSSMSWLHFQMKRP